MNRFLETSYDKFIFRASMDCVYSNDEIWVKTDGDVVMLGVTDYQQKSSGDVTLLNTVPVGIAVKKGDFVGTIETLKATVDIVTPVTGSVVEVNATLEASPFLINEDPFGSGWIYRIRATSPDGELAGMLSPEAYFEIMKKKVAEEAKNLYG